MAIPRGGDQGGIFATINITPLTDIFLVLLIIFMIATAITIESAAHVDLPRLQAPNTNQQPKGVTITYTSDHRIFVNGKSVAAQQLETELRDALGRTTEKLVVFDGEPRVILGDMVRVLDIAKSAGADQIALAVPHLGQASGADAGMAVPSGIPEPEAVVPDSGGPAPEPVAPSAQH